MKNFFKIMLVTALLPVMVVGTSLAAEYDIDLSHSSVNFQIKHLAISKVNGAFKDFSGSFSFDPEKPEATRADATIQLASVDTGNEKRDDHLRNPDFFDVAQYPTMTFTTTSVKMKDAEEGEVTGDLTLHGVTKSVTLDLEINGMTVDPWGNERIGASLTGEINRKDWGLTWNKAMETGGLVVGEDVKITLEIQGIKKK
jgi:polyisoprenoid-binding protein YceI